jgi:hypothetical protein
LEKGKCRLGTLVFIRSIRVQTVPATAGGRVVYRQVQVVATEKPFKGAARFPVPAFVPRDAMSFEAGGNHRLCLNGLLIEAGTLTATVIKTIGADGNKVPSFRIRVL